jgi:GTPase
MKNRLYKILCHIEFLKTSLRSSPIKSGYRPLFNFSKVSLQSGKIELIDKELLNQGERAYTNVYFVSDQLLKDVAIGKEFFFFEGPNKVGAGKVIDVLGWVNESI